MKEDHLKNFHGLQIRAAVAKVELKELLLAKEKEQMFHHNSLLIIKGI